MNTNDTYSLTYMTCEALYHYFSRIACGPIINYRIKRSTKGLRWRFTARYTDVEKTFSGLMSEHEAETLTVTYFKSIGREDWLKYFKGIYH